VPRASSVLVTDSAANRGTKKKATDTRDGYAISKTNFMQHSPFSEANSALS
jgi:hypothetical protein